MKSILIFHFRFRRICLLTFVVTLFIASLFITGTVRQTSAVTASAFATLSGCPLFPTNNIWNYDISHLPVHPNSAQVAGSPAFPLSPTVVLSPTPSLIVSVTATRTPQITRTPEIAEGPKQKLAITDNNIPPDSGVGSSGIGNTLPLVLGSIALVLAILGVALSIKWAKRLR